MYSNRMMGNRRTRRPFRDVQDIEFLESKSLTQSLQDHRYLSPVVDETFELYQLLLKIRERHTAPTLQGDAVTIVLALVLHCRRAFAQAVLTTMRGHASESDFFTRRAIEMAAMARVIASDPDQAQRWASAAGSEGEYRAYRQAFQSRTLFPKDNPAMRSLYDAYDDCSKRCHASVYGIGENVTMEAFEDVVRVQVHHLSDPEGENIAVSLLRVSLIHSAVLDVLADAAGILTSRKGTVWDAMRARLEFQITKANAFLEAENVRDAVE